MSIDPGVSIVISFLGFGWIFMKKIYPVIVRNLDEHIESVKRKIADAEKVQMDAVAALEKSKEKRKELVKIIAANQLESEKKIKKLQKENEHLLEILRERHTNSLKSQLEAEFIKRRELLLDRLSELIVKRVSEKIEADCEFPISLDKKDLNKFLKLNDKTIH